MAQTSNYIILRCRTGLTEPGIKFNLPVPVQPNTTDALVAANLLKYMVTAETQITTWEGYNADGSQNGDGVCNITGVAEGTFLDHRYAMFLILQGTSSYKRPSTQYIMAYPASFIANGELTAEGAATLANYSAGMVSAGFRTSENAVLNGVSFGHWSRRHNVQMVTG